MKTCGGILSRVIAWQGYQSKTETRWGCRWNFVEITARKSLRSLFWTRPNATRLSSELAPASPAVARDRLLRFMATRARVLERVDDSYGRIQDVYYQAIALIGQSSAKLSPEDAARLPDRIMIWRSKSAHGYMVDVPNAATAHLSDEALRQWDIALAAMDHPTSERKTRNGPERGWADSRRTPGDCQGSGTPCDGPSSLTSCGVGVWEPAMIQPKEERL